MEQKKPSSNCRVHGYTEYVCQSNGYFYCSTCRNDALKKWREKNRARVYEYKKKYLQDNPHIKKKWEKKYYEKNKEKINNKSREYRKKHAESIKKQEKEYRRKNKEIISLYQKKYRINNYDHIKFLTKRWRKIQIESLSDHYIKKLLTQNSSILNDDDLPLDIINTYRELIKLKRYLKEKNHVNTNSR
jgi:hypothetical protein